MLLEVEDLVVSFQTPSGPLRAVDGVSFQLEAGKTLGIVGESGSGKTVSALSIIRLIQEPQGRIERGRIILNGDDILKKSASEMRHIRGRQISMIFQEPMTSLNPVFTVGDQIREAILLHQHVSRTEAHKRCLEMMELVGIPDVEERSTYYPHQMSGGLRQRIMIAMALSCRPQVLIADEPTTALDVTIQAQILELMRNLQRKFGMAIILITHDFGVIAEMAAEVAVMYAGRIIERAAVVDIFDRPAHPYTIALQKAIPTYVRPGEDLYSIPGIVPDLRALPPGCRFSDRCSFKQDRCLQQDPSLQSLNAPTKHEASCYFPQNLGASA